MAENTIQFELVSPEERLMDEPATMVVLPGVEGDIGVLSGHSPLVSTIRPGVVNIYKQDMDKITDQLFIAGGFADVTAERVTLLAEEATPLTQIDASETTTAIETLAKDMDSAATDIEKKQYEKKIAILEAKLDALKQVA